MSKIKEDLARITRPTIKSFFQNYFFPRGGCFPYVFWFRVMQYCKKNKLLKYSIGFFIYLIFRYFEYKYGIHANTNISVGKGFFVVHGDGVYLNCNVIGENFTVYQGVTLGCSPRGGRPSVGNNVTIYTNAVIVGDITLGNNCVIGANTYVDKDIPDNSIVTGENKIRIKIRNE